MFNPEQFTHVYVIVPINQQSGSLNQGYYTVDGTIATMQEPTKTFKKDFFMDQLPHYGMNGVFDSVTGGQSNPKLDAAIDVAKRFDFKKISSQMSEKFKSFSLSLPIKCWGGVGFDTNAYMIHQNIINQFIHDLIIKANQAVEINDMAEVKKIAELFSFFPSALWQNFRLLTTQGYNACSRDNMMQIMVMAEHMAKVQVAFNAWLLNYTTQTQLGAISFKVTDIARLLNFQPPAHPNIPDLQRTAFNYNIKPSTTAFTPFVYNDYIRTLPTGNAFDIKQYIGTIKDVVPIFLLNVLGGGTKTEKEEYIKNNPVKTGKTDKAGGGVLGWVIGLTALGLAISQFTGKPKTATKTVATNNNKK